MRGTLIVIGICAVLAALSMLAPAVLNAVFDALDMLLGWMGPFLVVTLVSLGTGIIFLLAFPHVSAQGAIKKVKDRIKYNLLAIRIFQDDLPTVVKSTGGTLGWNFGYLGLNILPMVVLFVPFMVIWFQLNALYAFDPLRPGDERVLELDLRDGANPAIVALADPGPDAGWSIVRGPVRVLRTSAGNPKVLWTIRAEKAGIHEIEIGYDGGAEKVTKVLAVGERPQRLAQVRTAKPWSNFFAMRDPLVYFGETVLGRASFAQTVAIDFPRASVGGPLEGEIGIMLIFLVVSLVSAFLLKGAFGVEI